MAAVSARPMQGPRAPRPFERAAVAGQGRESEYLRYLPGIYQQNDFARRFLAIFESVLQPLERMVDNLPMYTEPELAPAEFLPWLARWVALSLDQSWPASRQRALIADAVEIYRWRGTQRGVKLHIKAYTGSEPVIQEYYDGFILGRQGGLGLTTTLGRSTSDSSLFVVAVFVSGTKGVAESVLQSIVDADKPAHTSYRLHVVRRSIEKQGR
jgi:phage tail-like protein